MLPTAKPDRSGSLTFHCTFTHTHAHEHAHTRMYTPHTHENTFASASTPTAASAERGGGWREGGRKGGREGGREKGGLEDIIHAFGVRFEFADFKNLQISRYRLVKNSEEARELEPQGMFCIRLDEVDAE